jgi:hypothetical protein
MSQLSQKNKMVRSDPYLYRDRHDPGQRKQGRGWVGVGVAGEEVVRTKPIREKGEGCVGEGRWMRRCCTLEMVAWCSTVTFNSDRDA